MIYFVRHGQTDWNVKGLYQGQTDIELNDTGVKQAEVIAAKLEHIKFDVVLASPLKRTKKTAQVIHNGDIIYDERLLERRNGGLEGKKKNREEIDFTDPNETRFNIEQLQSFRKRISDFWNEVIDKYKGKNVLVISHAGVSIYTQCYFKGDPKDGDYNKYKVKNCEILQYDN